MGRYYPDAYESYYPRTGFKRLVKSMFLFSDARRIRRIVGSAARILDVGAGAGEDAAFLRDRGRFRVEATDVNVFAAAQAKRYFHLEVRVGSLHSLGLQEAAYDLVRMRYVLSHVYSPRRTLAEAHRILKPGGWLVLWVPNADSWSWYLFGKHWEGGEAPRHLFSFSPKTLARYLADAGFSIVSLRQGIVPNTFIHSVRNLLEVLGAPQFVRRLFTLNPLMLAIFLPVSLAAALAGKSDRIMVIARK